MPWHNKEQPTAFDTAPMEGLLFLSGEMLARQYEQEWVRHKKYPVLTFPSGLQREVQEGSGGSATINIFGAFDLPRTGSRDEGFEHAIGFAEEYHYTLARRGERELLLFHPHSGHGYAVVYDNRARQIANILRFPDHAMELLDGESRAVLPPLYSAEKLGDRAIAPVKFFTPDANWTWYASEYDGKDLFFGLVSGFEVELGYFSLTELEGVRGALGLPVERDLYFTPQTIRDLQRSHLI